MSGPLVGAFQPAAPGTSTLANLRTCVYMGLRDDNRDFVPPGDVDYFLNEGYVDIAARLRLYKKEFAGTTTSTGTIPFPSDYIEIDTLFIGTTTLQEVSDDVFDSYRIPGGTPGTADHLYRFFGTNIETYPVAGSDAYTLRYVARPPKLANDADVFTHLPPELEVRLCNYGRAQCRYLMEEDTAGERYMRIYLSGLPDYPRAAQRWGKGPRGLVPVPGVFD